jgi:hypothetical protein
MLEGANLACYEGALSCSETSNCVGWETSVHKGCMLLL